MNRDDIIRRFLDLHPDTPIDGQEYAIPLRVISRMLEAAAATEREKLAHWMIEHGYATGHGDTIEDLLTELGWQADERITKAAAAEREKVAQMIEDAPPLVDFSKNEHDGCLMCGFTPKLAASAIRARGSNG